MDFDTTQVVIWLYVVLNHTNKLVIANNSVSFSLTTSHQQHTNLYSAAKTPLSTPRGLFAMRMTSNPLPLLCLGTRHRKFSPCLCHGLQPLHCCPQLRDFHYCGLTAPPENQEARTPHTALIRTSGIFKKKSLGVEYPVNQADTTSIHHMKHKLLVAIRALSTKKAQVR